MRKLIQTYRRRQLRKFAKTFKLEIQERFGKKVFYSAGEIEDVATLIGVSSKQREWAYGMFAEEPACQGFLSRIGSSRTAKELRFVLAGLMFGGGGGVGYDFMWNRFDDPDDTVMGGLSKVPGGSLDGATGDSSDDDLDTGDSDGDSSA